MPTSNPDTQLIRLDHSDDFIHFALQLIPKARRQLRWFSHSLAHVNHPDIYQALSATLRSSPAINAKLLVKDVSPLVERGHTLLRLQQRLPSKCQMHQLDIEPEDDDIGFLVIDRQALLFWNDEAQHQGFVHFDDKAECQRRIEQFDYLWNHSHQPPDCRHLCL